MNLVNKHKLNSIKPTPLSFGEGPGVRLFGARYVACPDERGNSVPIAFGIRVWLSVDTMSDKISWISSLNYWQNNLFVRKVSISLIDYDLYVVVNQKALSEPGDWRAIQKQEKKKGKSQ